MNRKAVSVVVTIVSGGDSARRCLGRLFKSARPWLEVVVPLEADHPDRAKLAREFPAASFPVAPLPAGAVSEHERYDRRRSAGILASEGAVVGILEDHGTPAPDWPERVRDAHAALPHAVIGGVVTNGVSTARNDALWLCDFGRYAPPQAPGPRPALTDVNVSYKREPLVAIRESWEPRFHEPVVHEALAARGATLWLDPSIVIAEERPPISLLAALRERFEWGRLFGRLRGRKLGPAARLLSGILSFFVAPLLFFRICRLQPGRLPLLRLVKATPWIGVLLLGWSVGEAVGTLSPGSASYNPLPKEQAG